MSERCEERDTSYDPKLAPLFSHVFFRTHCRGAQSLFTLTPGRADPLYFADHSYRRQWKRNKEAGRVTQGVKVNRYRGSKQWPSKKRGQTNTGKQSSLLYCTSSLARFPLIPLTSARDGKTGHRGRFSIFLSQLTPSFKDRIYCSVVSLPPPHARACGSLIRQGVGKIGGGYGVPLLHAGLPETERNACIRDELLPTAALKNLAPLRGQREERAREIDLRGA